MMTFVYVLAGLALALHAYRQWWTHRNLPRVHTAQFDGELYRVGATVIARRPAREGSRRSVICFPGFLEDMRYFQSLYAEEEGELILVNNANYHSAFSDGDEQALDWPDNPHPLGAIEHDGFYLGLVLERLAGGAEVVLHGHSRGGAVVLETGRQYPQLTRDGERQVSAILEAPVLPRARVVGRGSDPVPNALIRYFMPIALGLGRKTTPEQLNKQPMMRPTNDLKTSLCLSVYTVPRVYATCVTNARSIRDWQRDTGHDLYNNYGRITVVIGERDDVLDNASMLASAEAGRALNPGVEILRTEQTNHFPTLERPEYLLRLHREITA